MLSYNPVLAIVIPVYNEAARLPALLRDWRPEFEKTGSPYKIIFIDDGSTDKSLDILQAMQAVDLQIAVHTQANAGHGPAILKGYGLSEDAEWVFQIDSDHQLDPAAFSTLWANRDGYDLLLAQRRERKATAGRRWISRISTGIVRLFYGKGIADVNSPYRLMRGACLQQALPAIPGRSFAPNILLTAWFIGKKKRIFTTFVRHRSEDSRPSRTTGPIFRGALRSALQTMAFRLKL